MNLLCIALTKSTPGQAQVYSIRIDTKPDRGFHDAIADHKLRGNLAIGTRGDQASLKKLSDQQIRKLLQQFTERVATVKGPQREVR